MQYVDKNAVIQCRQDGPGLTQQQIGDQFGISRERVRQILSEAGVATKNTSYYVITKPDKPTTRKLTKRGSGYSYTCPVCGGKKHPYSKTCKRCYTNPRDIIVHCCICGTELKKKPFSYNQTIKRNPKARFYCPYCWRGPRAKYQYRTAA